MATQLCLCPGRAVPSEPAHQPVLLSVTQAQHQLSRRKSGAFHLVFHLPQVRKFYSVLEETQWLRSKPHPFPKAGEPLPQGLSPAPHVSCSWLEGAVPLPAAGLNRDTKGVSWLLIAVDSMTACQPPRYQ